MFSRLNDSAHMIDPATSRSICDAVGERLQRDFRPNDLGPSSHLERLLDELRRQDQIDGR